MSFCLNVLIEQIVFECIHFVYELTVYLSIKTFTIIKKDRNFKIVNSYLISYYFIQGLHLIEVF